MSKSARRAAKLLSTLASGVLAPSFARQGFASSELVTRWAEIVGPEIAAHAEPVKIQWARSPEGDDSEPGTLVLRVEGPAALEIQHLSGMILERVNRFFGWPAVARLGLRQAPLRSRPRPAPKAPDPALAERIKTELGELDDEALRNALARLGAAVRRS
jgi:hypothetical protein